MVCNHFSCRGTGGSFIETISPSAPHYESFENDQNSEAGAVNEDHSAPISFKDLKRKESGEDEAIEEIATHQGFANPLFAKSNNPMENLAAVDPENEPPSQSKKSYENPLFDMMVDITKEASKHDKTDATNEDLTEDAPVDFKQCFEQNFREMEAKIQEKALSEPKEIEKESNKVELLETDYESKPNLMEIESTIGDDTQESIQEAKESINLDKNTTSTVEEAIVQPQVESENPPLVEI